MFNLTKKQTSIIAVMAVVAAVMFAGPIALGLEIQQASAGGWGGGWWWHHHHHHWWHHHHWGWNSWW
jgi:hypothetical protein